MSTCQSKYSKTPELAYHLLGRRLDALVDDQVERPLAAVQPPPVGGRRATAVLLTPVVMTAEGDGPMGQAPMSFFAPNPALAAGSHPAAASQELKLVIKQLHAHGIEVILQVCMHETTE